MGHNVFISYSSKDEKTALQIYHGLTNRGAKCWISKEHVSPGGNYQNEIVSALTSSSVMVLIFSHNANSSTDIQKEIALAGQFQLTVIPLKIDDVMPSGGFILNLATSQWVEVFPNIEITLDTVTRQIKAITERIEKFALEVRQALEEDGAIEANDQKYLEEEVGVKMGLTVAQSRAIIKSVLGGSTPANVQERELDYLHVITEVLEDGKITSLEKKRLKDRAKSLGISDSRAQALLEQEKAELGLSDALPPVAKDNNCDQTLPSKPYDEFSPTQTTSDDLSWPNVGLNFLKAINQELDFPFTPVWMSNDEDIDNYYEADWQMNDRHYLSIWIDRKSRKSGKVTIYWGFYSDNAARDPKFRYVCKEICDIEGKFFGLNDYRYEFVSDGFLGLQTSERLTFEEMVQELYIRKIADQLLAFSQEIWPLVSKI